jgi:hypothetical protein
MMASHCAVITAAQWKETLRALVMLLQTVTRHTVTSAPFFFGGYVFPELQSELSLQEETRPYDSAFPFSCCDRSTEFVTAIIAA